MKKIIVLISVAAAALFAASSLSAQGKYGPDSTECIKYLSYYTEYYKQKNYDSALPNWRNAYKYCPPTSRYSLLSDGTTLLRRLITQNAKNPVYKDQLVDSLMTLYKQRVEEIKDFDPMLLRFLSVTYFAEYLSEKEPLGHKQHIAQVIRFMNAGRDRKKHR